MKVIKPLLLGCLWRTYKREGNRLSLTGLLAFPFSDPDVPLTEQDMWKSVAPLIPPDTAWDEGIPKDRGEVLLVGECHAAGRSPISRRQVSLRVGTVTKVLDVFGDRAWTRDRGFLRKSDPQSFLSIPVDFSHAFGGPGYGPNPIGKGFAEPQDGSPRPLPNIEDPFRPLSSPDDRPDPAGFGPLGLVWTGRYSKVGTYRPQELGKEPPPLPANTDWTFFNQAHPDQWLPEMWSGGEEFSLSGFHPQSDTQSGRLPRIRIRAFVTFLDDRTVEATMLPETVWLFPGLSMGVVVHRGSLLIASDDASEIGSILLGAEDPGENRSMDHYLTVRNSRIDRKSKDYSRFSDVPLLPERLADDPRANLFDVGTMMKNAAKGDPKPPPKWVSAQLDRAQDSLGKLKESFSRQMASPGGKKEDLENIFPDQTGKMDAMGKIDAAEEKLREVRAGIENPLPPSSPTEKLEELKNAPDEFEKYLSQLDSMKQQAAQKFKDSIDRIPPDVLEKLGKTREDLLSKIDINGLSENRSKIHVPQKSIPSTDGLLDKNRIVSSLQSSRDRIAASLPEGVAPSPAMSEKLAQMDASIESTSRMLDKVSDAIPPFSTKDLGRVLHLFAPPDPDPARSSELRQTVLEELSRSRLFKDRNLRGVDLSGLDLSGTDFSDADLVGADFSGSNLSGTRLAGAWVAYANFSGCILDRTDFSGAGLGCANLTGSRGTGVSFQKAFLSGATLSGASLAEGDFSGADLLHTVFRGSSLHKGNFSQAKFLRAGSIPFPPSEGLPTSEESIPRFPIEETDFTGSDFTKSVFLKVDFLRSTFANCRMEKVTFLECTGPGTRFDGADLKKAAFPKSKDFKQSSFLKADLSGANLRGLDLESSDFREALLVGMDGSEAIFRTANLSGTTAQKARFMKSDLRFANGRGGDFSQALFLKADLRGTNFSRSSLYKAGFTGAQIDSTTLWDHSLTGKTTLSQERDL